MDANIYQKAVVANDKKRMTMYVGNNMNVWRNSVYKNWGNQKFTVDCINFKDVIKDTENCVKMDIEGAEMDILENMDLFPNKIVFEWSLDIDGSLNRYRKIIDKFKAQYKNIIYRKQFYGFPDDFIPKNIPAKCDNIYCYEKN